MTDATGGTAISLSAVRAIGTRGEVLLDGLDLSLAAGSSTAVIGPSGAGKTTLLRLLAGLVAPAAGELRFDDAVVSRANEVLLPPGRRAVGYLPQDAGLWDHLRVAAHIELVLAASQPLATRRAIREQAGEWLGRLQLDRHARRRAGVLSGGERRRLALGRALAIRPRVLLLDEAFSALDYSLRDEMLALLTAWRAEHACTLIAVTHVREESVQLADNVVVLEAGRAVPSDGPFANRFFARDVRG